MKKRMVYTRVRKKRTKARHKSERSRPSDRVLFAQGSTEFPVATVIAHDSRSKVHALGGDLARWLMSGWSWFRPRTVPVLVAALGLLAVLASADYLRHVKTAPPHYSQK